AQGAGDSVSEHLRQAILKVLGVRVKFIARVEGAAAAPAAPAAAPPAASAAPPAPAAAPAAGGWNVTPIPNSAPADDEVPPPGDDDMPPAFDDAPPPEDAWAAAPAPASTPEPASPAPAPAPAPAQRAPSSSSRASNPNRPGRYGEA